MKFEIELKRLPSGILVTLNDRVLMAFPTNTGEPELATYSAVIFADGAAAAIRSVQGLMDQRSDRDAEVVIIGGGADALKP